MDKTSLSISLDTERLDALNYYLLKEKTSSLQKELGRMVEELYEKTVPPDVRDYIDSRGKKAAPPKPKVKPPAKPAAKAESGARWDIQIGGFSAKEGAELTVKQAKESGYSVYIVDSVLNGKPFYKVRVRGESDKKSSQELSKRLAKAGFPVYLVEIKR